MMGDVNDVWTGYADIQDYEEKKWQYTLWSVHQLWPYGRYSSLCCGTAASLTDALLAQSVSCGGWPSLGRFVVYHVLSI